jgi:class 3 adenylate cyclase
MLAEFPEVRYADAGGSAIAYSAHGEGSLDLVVVPGVMTSIVGAVMNPVVGDFYERLSSFSRLIQLDRRGTGMSDPLSVGAAPPLEQQVGDVVAVMDAVESDQAALYGVSHGGPVAIMCAAIRPERVSALILNCTIPCYDDHMWGPSGETQVHRLEQLRHRWGNVDDPWQLETIAPRQAAEPGFAATFARVQQVSASKSAAAAAFEAWWSSDVREVLALVQVPTLILFPDGVPSLREAGQYLEQHIADARVITRPGPDFLLPTAVGELSATIAEFLTGVRPAVPTNRVLATVLFTDIVASTEMVVEVGDEQWRRLLDTHDDAVRVELASAEGREVKHTGDGFLAVFDGPARAIGCARAIIHRAAAAGVAVRAGVHVGECEKRGDDLAGVAVHVGARVCSLAGPGEILVTSTVRDLVAGSGIEFVERGDHPLKGLPGTWPILAVRT